MYDLYVCIYVYFYVSTDKYVYVYYVCIRIYVYMIVCMFPKL